MLVISSGCTTLPGQPRLPLPPPPDLPRISEAELQCLTDDAYLKLLERDRRQAGHIRELQGIIRATH